MNTFTTIDKKYADNVKGMKIAVPWDMKIGKGKNLRDKAYQTWGGDINWRTAMSYDATNAIIEVLKTDPDSKVSRVQLLNLPQNFQGATGEIKFRSKRKLSVSLIEVAQEDQKDQNNPGDSQTPYIFKPIKSTQ